MEGVGPGRSQSSWQFRGSCCVPTVLPPPSMVPAWGIHRSLCQSKQWALSDFILGFPSCGYILCNTAILIYCSLDVSLLQFCFSLPGTPDLHFMGFLAPKSLLSLKACYWGWGLGGSQHGHLLSSLPF